MFERISPREATHRMAAIACLAGLALLQVIALPATLARGATAAPAVVAIVGCAGVAALLLFADEARARRAWVGVAAVGFAVLAGWLVPRMIVLPGVEGLPGRWTTAAGLASAALALGAISVAAVAMGRRPGQRVAADLAGAAAVIVCLAPSAAVLLALLAPPAAATHAMAASHAAHGPGAAEPQHSAALHAVAVASRQAFRPGFGGHAGHYVYPNAVPPHLPPWALAIALGAVCGFLSLAAGALHRRQAQALARRPRGAPAGRSLAAP